MEKQYKYRLEKGNKKYLCPQCGKKTFVRYIDSITGECCPEQYGRCDREIKCGYINTPIDESKTITAYFVQCDTFISYSDKSYLISQEGAKFYIPKKMVFEVEPKGCFIVDWYLINAEKKPLFNDFIYKVFNNINYPAVIQTPAPKPQPLVSIPFEVLGETLTDYEHNVFIQNLMGRVAFPFEPCDIEAVIAQYYLGTVASFGGAVTFPFIDIQNNIRAIQVKQFDQANHTTKTSFLHSILKYNYSKRGNRLPDWLPAYELNDTKVSCLFGEHLLNKYPLNPVALVEAPKSAIYGTLYFGLPTQPARLLWLAVYNLSSLNTEKCKALKGREVFLFPDLSTDGKAFDLWSEKAKELNAKIQGAKFTVSDLLEREASQAEREKGCDIADFLILQDWRLFRPSAKSVKSETQNKDFLCAPQPEKELPSVKSAKSASQNNLFLLPPQKVERVVYQYPTKEDWTYQINELESYFAAVTLPASPLRLNNYSVIIDVPLFIQSHLDTVKTNNGQPTFLPYLNRLHELKQLINN